MEKLPSIWTDEKKAELERFCLLGLNNRQIQLAMTLTKGQVMGAIRRYGFRDRWDAAKKALAKAIPTTESKPVPKPQVLVLPPLEFTLPPLPPKTETEWLMEEFIAKNGVKREVTFGVHQPFVDYLRSIGWTINRSGGWASSQNKGWVLNHKQIVTTQRMYQLVNSMRKTAGLPLLAPLELAKSAA